MQGQLPELIFTLNGGYRVKYSRISPSFRNFLFPFYKPTGLMRSDGGGAGRLARFSFWLLRLQNELESFRFLDVHTSFIKYKQNNASRSFIALQTIETARPPKLDENGF